MPSLFLRKYEIALKTRKIGIVQRKENNKFRSFRVQRYIYHLSAVAP